MIEIKNNIPTDELPRSGRSIMVDTVGRQQRMLADILLRQEEEKELARTQRLGRYIGLLHDPMQLANQAIADEFTGLVQEFYIPRNVDEERRIIDAGGITYGF